MKKGNVNIFESDRGSTHYQWLIAILANTTMLTYGLQAGWISPMSQILQSDHSPSGQPLSDSELSWIASVLCMSAAISVSLYSYLADKYVTINSTFTMLTYGLQAGWISPMSQILQSDHSPSGRPLSDSEFSWIASVLCMSAAISVSLYSYLADKYGRKICIILIVMLQTISWIVKINSSSTVGLIIARLFCGIASGGCFTSVPIYTKEISQDNIRGTLGSLLTLFSNVGILSMYVLGAYLDYFTVLWIVIWIPVLTMLLMLKAPESPSFLVKKGEIDKATEALAFLRGLKTDDKLVIDEVETLRATDLYYRSLPDISLLDLYRNKVWRRSFILIISMITVLAANGNFAILTYASTIMAAFNVTISPELQSMSFPAVMILGSLISMHFVERLGRKPLLASTLVVTVISMSCIATSLLLNHWNYNVPSWIPVAATVTSTCMYALGASPVPYIVMAEIFNFQIRAKVIGCVITYSWTVSFIHLSSFVPMANALGNYSVFYYYTAINLYGLFVSLIFLPETKGKTMEEIEDIMGRRKH